MTSPCFENEKKYGLTIHIARIMLSAKIITEEEFIKIRETAAVKFRTNTACLILDSIKD